MIIYQIRDNVDGDGVSVEFAEDNLEPHTMDHFTSIDLAKTRYATIAWRDLDDCDREAEGIDGDILAIGV